MEKMNFGYHPVWLTFYDPTLQTKFREFLMRKGRSMWQLIVGQFVFTSLYLPYCAIYYEKHIVRPFEGLQLFLWLTFYVLTVTLNVIGTVAVLAELHVDYLCKLLSVEKTTLESLIMSMKFYYVSFLSLSIGMCMSIRSLVRCPTVTSASTMFFCNYSGNRDIPTDHFIFLMLSPIFVHVAVPVEWGAILICWPLGLLCMLISMYLSGDPMAPGLSVLFTCSTLTYAFALVYCLSVMINYNIQTKMMFNFLLNLKETDDALMWSQQHRGMTVSGDHAIIVSDDDDNASTISVISSVTGTMRTDELNRLRLRKRLLVMEASSVGSPRQIVTKMNDEWIRQEKEQKGVRSVANHIDAKPLAVETRLSTVEDEWMWQEEEQKELCSIANLSDIQPTASRLSTVTEEWIRQKKERMISRIDVSEPEYSSSNNTSNNDVVTISIACLPSNADLTLLQDLFSPYGRIISAEIVDSPTNNLDLKKNAHSGRGRVQISDLAQAQYAQQVLHGAIIFEGGRPLEVNII